jgi:hypothetical protein
MFFESEVVLPNVVSDFTMLVCLSAVVLEDVYKYLKLPSPLGQHQLLFHSEDHMDSYLQCGTLRACMNGLSLVCSPTCSSR